MKTLFVIPVHSFVDLITNSSSELFVCSTKKSAEAVKTLLARLLENHNEFGEHPHAYSFDGCFGRVFEAPFTFDLSKFDPAIVRRYKEYKASEYDYHFSGRERTELTKPESWLKAETAKRKLRETHPYYKMSSYNYETATPAQKKKHEKLWRELCDAEEGLFAEFRAELFDAEYNLFIEFLRVNNFDEATLAEAKTIKEKDLALFKKEGRHWAAWSLRVETPTTPLEKAFDFYYDMESWGVVVNKGQILVYSSGDNSVPFSLFDPIEEYLHAQRYHLG